MLLISQLPFLPFNYKLNIISFSNIYIYIYFIFIFDLNTVWFTGLLISCWPHPGKCDDRWSRLTFTLPPMPPSCHGHQVEYAVHIGPGRWGDQVVSCVISHQEHTKTRGGWRCNIFACAFFAPGACSGGPISLWLSRIVWPFTFRSLLKINMGSVLFL